MVSLDPRRALDALASEHGLPILRFLKDRGWTLASQVADGLGIHTTTASKHLAAFHEAGLLERREHPAKRPTFAYRLTSPVIRLEFDLGEPADGADAASAAEAFLEALLDAARQVEGAPFARNLARSLVPADDWRTALRARLASSRDPKADLRVFVRDARRTCADALGPTTADRLMQRAIDAGFGGRQDLLMEVSA